MSDNKDNKDDKSLLAPKEFTTGLEKLLLIAMATPMGDPHDPNCIWGAPILLWGPPGIAKSMRVEEVARMLGLPLGTVYLSTHQPEDISGVFMSDGRGGAITVCPLPQVNQLVAAQCGILFLDELTDAVPAMQAAGLSVVRERYWAGHRLPGRIRVVAAANPVDMAAGGFILKPPMANRFLHINVGVPSNNDWAGWLMTGAHAVLDPITHSEALIKERWAEVWTRTRALGAGFMKRTTTDKKQMRKLYNLPNAGHPSRSRAWPSPRTWEYALRCVAAAEILGARELGVDLLGAAVGVGFEAMWREWVNYANLPDPEHMLRNGWRADPDRLDIAAAAYASAVGYVLELKDPQKRKEYAILAWKLFEAPMMHDHLSDVVLGPITTLIRAGFAYAAGGEFKTVAGDITYKLGSLGLAQYMNKR